MTTILIVEDNDSTLFLYKRLLEIKGYEVVAVARNGAEAVEVYRTVSIKPEVIIMDYRMPVKNGIEALKEILQLNPAAKIIFASADTSVKDLALSIGALRFNLKPFQIDLLISNIENLAKMSS